MAESRAELLELLRGGGVMDWRRQFRLTIILATPSMIAQLSSIMMQFIDASMVGSLGADAAASIGLVSTVLWMFGSFCYAAAAGFYVQSAHLVGAKDFGSARSVLRQGITTLLIFSLLLGGLGVILGKDIPRWLGGGQSILADSSAYLMINMAFLPALQFEALGVGMLQSTGNTKVPSMVGILMCVMDVIFNFFLIFPTRDLGWITIPGAGLGVEGAALGTGLAETVAVTILTLYIIFRSKELSLSHERGSFIPTGKCLRSAAAISVPMGLQNLVIRGANVASTAIVAPLGNIAIAANSFAITAESFCYMPGYGIGDAATSLVGQSLGARRKDLAKGFAKITMLEGMTVMTFLSAIMFLTAPWLIGLMSPDPEVVALGAKVLRIECFAETMFAAGIVGYAICVGAGDTMIPSIINFSSIWVVRIGLSLILIPHFGLAGFWIGMCADLNVRGILFLLRIAKGWWLRNTMETRQKQTIEK